jgi:hypothetical protein
MTAATTTSGVGGAVTGAAFLQATAAIANAATKTAALTRRITGGISQFRCDLIERTIMLNQMAPGELSSLTAQTLTRRIAIPLDWRLQKMALDIQ